MTKQQIKFIKAVNELYLYIRVRYISLLLYKIFVSIYSIIISLMGYFTVLSVAMISACHNLCHLLTKYIH
jgi:hypothetical protein